MNLHRFIISLLALWGLVASVCATQLSPSRALSRASMAERSALRSASSSYSLQRTVTDRLGHNLFYIFQHRDGRLFFVSADDCAKPLLGYTDKPLSADSIPQPLEEWLQTYAKQIAYGIAHPADVKPVSLPVREAGRLKSLTVDFPSVDPLVDVKWGSRPFNTLLPVYDTAHCVPGCVALSILQVMYYHQYPARGRDTVSYMAKVEDEVRLLEADLSQSAYNWKALDDLTSEEGKAAAAIVGRDCAYAVHASFGLSSTSAKAVNIKNVLYRYFAYDSTITTVARLNDDVWFRILYNELENGRPFICAGYGTMGHAFVGDGYNQADTTFHFLWGWYGLADGYYSLSALNPGLERLNENNYAVVGIQPPGSFVKGSDHVFGYGDLTLNPYTQRRAGCTTLTSLGVSTTKTALGSVGVFFAPPVYPSAQVVLQLTDELRDDTILLGAEFGKMLSDVQLTYDSSLFISFDCVPINNSYSFLNDGATYKVELLYRDFADEPFRPVSFVKGARDYAYFTLLPNGKAAVEGDSVPPLVRNFWVMDTVRAYASQGLRIGSDAMAVGQVLFAHLAPNSLTGSIRYDGENFTNLQEPMAYTDEAAFETLGKVALAIRSRRDEVAGYLTSVPAMVYGLKKNLGLTTTQYASRRFYKTADWYALLDSQLHMGYPVYYCGENGLGEESHQAFVVDGTNGKGLYHTNFTDGVSPLGFRNLNVADRIPGSVPGAGNCLPFAQGMLLNLAPNCSGAYAYASAHPFMLVSPLVVNGDSTQTNFKLAAGENVSVSFLLADCLAGEAGYDASATYAVGVATINADGKIEKVLAYESLPVTTLRHTLSFGTSGLRKGDYKLALVTSADNVTFEPVYDNAPNTMLLSVGSNTLELQVPFNPTFGADLHLTEKAQVKDNTLWLNIGNATDANYEDVLRLVVKPQTGDSLVSDAQKVAVYGQTTMEYALALNEPLLSALLAGGTLQGYYYKAGEGWLPLMAGVTGCPAIPAETAFASGTGVYSVSGALLASFGGQQTAKLEAYLSKLPSGVYVLLENGTVRKFVKQ